MKLPNSQIITEPVLVEAMDLKEGDFVCLIGTVKYNEQGEIAIKTNNDILYIGGSTKVSKIISISK